MKYLILLSRKYPFLSGEPFLENEIEEIAPHFDKILIFPTNACLADQPSRHIQATNVDVCVTERTKIKYRHYKYGMNGVVRAVLGGKIGKKPIKDAYFLSFAQSFTKHVADYLQSHYHFTKDDEVVLYSYWLYVTAQVAIYLKKQFQSRVKKMVCIARAHGFDIYEELRGYLPFQQQLVEAVDKVYPCSENGTEYLQAKFPACAGKIETAYLGTYDHGLNPDADKNSFHIVSCSRVAKVKRVDLIVDTLKLLQHENLPVKWTHLGGGDLLEHIRGRVNQELNHIQVELTGMIPNKEVYSFYQNHPVDLFVNVSSSEGLPVSIMEAISFGIPVLATDVGGTSEIVENSVDGNLIPVDFKPEELAERIKEYIQIPSEEMKALRTTTRGLWKERFQAVRNYDLFAKNLLKL